MPKFTTVIPCNGPNGNIFTILGTARSLLKRLPVTKFEIDELSNKVMDAGSYTEALGYIQEYFPLSGLEEE